MQAVLPEDDVSTGTSLVVFARSFGGAIFVPVGQTVFNKYIVSGIRDRVPEVNPSAVLQSGATELQQTVDAIVAGRSDVVDRVLRVYNHALVQAFLVALILACVSIIGAVGVEWKSVKGVKIGGPQGGQDDAEHGV